MNSSVPSGDLVRVGVSNHAGSLAAPRKFKVDWVDSDHPGGPAKLRPVQRRDRRPPFTRKKSKLNTKSPPRGGGQKVCCEGSSRTGAPSTQRVFFPLPEFSGGVRDELGEFASQFKARLPNRARERVFIFRCARGAVKSLGPHKPGPAGSPQRHFREFPKTFFRPRSTARRSRRQKNRREIR